MRVAAGLLALALWASGAAAQDADGSRPALFLSPMGEPFRGPNGAQSWFGRADSDGDGRVTPAEFDADALAFFRQLDPNGDQLLDGFELQAYERTHAPEITGIYYAGEGDERRGDRMMRQRRSGFGPFRGKRGPYAAREGAGRFTWLNIPQPVTGADADADRRVSLEEWKRVAALRFGLLDRAKAGALTWATLPPLPDAREP